jgi:Plavaka transposase
MKEVLGPIRSYGETGLEMSSDDGVWWRCHLIFAIFAGDYQEQVLMTCTYYSCCPKCTVPASELGQYKMFLLHIQSDLLNTYELANGDFHTFHLACHDTGVKPVHQPFWATLPLANVFLSITPNILHQLLQGMVRHLISWLTGIFGAVAIDARCHAMPPNHKVTIFTKGISILSHISGHRHKKMCSFLLGLIIDLPIPGGQPLSRVI